MNGPTVAMPWLDRRIEPAMLRNVCFYQVFVFYGVHFLRFLYGKKSTLSIKRPVRLGKWSNRRYALDGATHRARDNPIF